MKIYTLSKKQFLPITLDQAWDFFSSPVNLKKITPEYMGFEITSDLGDGKMYSGQIISYVVTPVLGIPMSWTTEITHVIDKKYFVDEQRFGPCDMHEETFVFQLDQAVPDAFVSAAQAFQPVVVDREVEMTLSREHDLNMAFELFQQSEIRVMSMRNKTNRLEEFFIQKIKV